MHQFFLRRRKKMNKKAMYNLSYGLFVLTARSGEKDNGCIINTAGQVTSTPNRITVTVNKENYTNDMICESGKFNISVLSERADFALFRHFGFQSGRTVDKFADYSACKRSENGLYYITQGTNAYLSATVEQTIDLGSHTMFIASVEDMDVLSQDPSATYAYYQSSIKPKPEQEQKVSGGKVVWRCTICGFVYEGEELPPDYVCPLCKHPASDFERVVL